MGKLHASKKPRRQQEQQEAKRPARGQQEASKRPARSKEASKKPAKAITGFASILKNQFSREIFVGKLEASKKPRSQQ